EDGHRVHGLLPRGALAVPRPPADGVRRLAARRAQVRRVEGQGDPEESAPRHPPRRGARQAQDGLRCPARTLVPRGAPRAAGPRLARPRVSRPRVFPSRRGGTAHPRASPGHGGQLPPPLDVASARDVAPRGGGVPADADSRCAEESRVSSAREATGGCAPRPADAFGFGRNWKRYVERYLDPERVAIAAASLRDLAGEPLAGKSF